MSTEKEILMVQSFFFNERENLMCEIGQAESGSFSIDSIVKLMEVKIKTIYMKDLEFRLIKYIDEYNGNH